MKKFKKFKKLKNKIKGLSIELDKNTTKLSDLDELDGVIEDFKKETDDRYEVDVSVDIIKGSKFDKGYIYIHYTPTPLLLKYN